MGYLWKSSFRTPTMTWNKEKITIIAFNPFLYAYCPKYIDIITLFSILPFCPINLMKTTLNKSTIIELSISSNNTFPPFIWDNSWKFKFVWMATTAKIVENFLYSYNNQRKKQKYNLSFRWVPFFH